MGNKKWFAVGLALCLLLGSVLPTAAASQGSWLTCTLKFDSAHDDTECRGRGIYTIPAAGGNALLLVGIYARHIFFLPEEVEAEGLVGGPEADALPEGIPVEDLRIPLTTKVRVVLYDSKDQDSRLFSFEGILEELMELAGAEVLFTGHYGVLIKIPLVVPPGETDWIGRLDVMVGGTKAHCDTFLLRGFVPS